MFQVSYLQNLVSVIVLQPLESGCNSVATTTGKWLPHYLLTRFWCTSRTNKICQKIKTTYVVVHFLVCLLYYVCDFIYTCVLSPVLLVLALSRS